MQLHENYKEHICNFCALIGMLFSPSFITLVNVIISFLFVLAFFLFLAQHRKEKINSPASYLSDPLLSRPS